eukprot:scaffold12118_cov138-Cylindrotheca_fusiformis.AAC.6
MAKTESTNNCYWMDDKELPSDYQGTPPRILLSRTDDKELPSDYQGPPPRVLLSRSKSSPPFYNHSDSLLAAIVEEDDLSYDSCPPFCITKQRKASRNAARVNVVGSISYDDKDRIWHQHPLQTSFDTCPSSKSSDSLDGHPSGDVATVKDRKELAPGQESEKHHHSLQKRMLLFSIFLLSLGIVTAVAVLVFANEDNKQSHSKQAEKLAKSDRPTMSPNVVPLRMQSTTPTMLPSRSPRRSQSPSEVPSHHPSIAPSRSQSPSTSRSPSNEPSPSPSKKPTTSAAPTFLACNVGTKQECSAATGGIRRNQQEEQQVWMEELSCTVANSYMTCILVHCSDRTWDNWELHLVDAAEHSFRLRPYAEEEVIWERLEDDDKESKSLEWLLAKPTDFGFVFGVPISFIDNPDILKVWVVSLDEEGREQDRLPSKGVLSLMGDDYACT